MSPFSRRFRVEGRSRLSGYLPCTKFRPDLTQNGPVNCQLINLGNAVVLNNCFETQVLIGRAVLAGGGDAVLVDLGETAAVTKLSSTGAEITTVADKIIQATWAPGDVLSSWDNGFPWGFLVPGGMEPDHFEGPELGLTASPDQFEIGLTLFLDGAPAANPSTLDRVILQRSRRLRGRQNTMIGTILFLGSVALLVWLVSFTKWPYLWAASFVAGPCSVVPSARRRFSR